MAQVDNTTTAVTGSVALTTTEAQVATVTPGGVPSPNSVRTTPWALVIVTVPNITGIATTASVTLNIRSGTSAAGTLIGAMTATNPGAGTSAIGGFTAQALVPVGVDSVWVGALTSSGTGSMVASATAPIVVTVLVLD